MKNESLFNFRRANDDIADEVIEYIESNKNNLKIERHYCEKELIDSISVDVKISDYEGVISVERYDDLSGYPAYRYEIYIGSYDDGEIMDCSRSKVKKIFKMLDKIKPMNESTSATGGLAVGAAGNVYGGGNAATQEFSRRSVDNSGEDGSYNKSETNDYINKNDLPKKLRHMKKKKRKLKHIDSFHENATANASNTAGMGNVVSSQPSSYAGATIGTNFSGHGGTVGSGDVSVPYNPGGVSTYMNQKLKIKPAGRKRKGMPKLTSKTLKPKRSKVMNFREYTQDTLNHVTKINDFGVDREFGNSYNEEKNYNSIAMSGVKNHTGDKLDKEVESENIEKVLKKVQNRLSNFIKLKIEKSSLVGDDVNIELNNDKFKVMVGEHPTEYFKLEELGKMIEFVKGYVKSA